MVDFMGFHVGIYIYTIHIHHIPYMETYGLHMVVNFKWLVSLEMAREWVWSGSMAGVAAPRMLAHTNPAILVG